MKYYISNLTNNILRVDEFDNVCYLSINEKWRESNCSSEAVQGNVNHYTEIDLSQAYYRSV